MFNIDSYAISLTVEYLVVLCRQENGGLIPVISRIAMNFYYSFILLKHTCLISKKYANPYKCGIFSYCLKPSDKKQLYHVVCYANRRIRYRFEHHFHGVHAVC
jgi:hypothetical protein